MMTMNAHPDRILTEEIQMLVQEALVLSADVSPQLAKAVRMAAEYPLPEEEVRALFTKIVAAIKRASEQGADDASIVREVERIVDRLMSSRSERLSPMVDPIARPSGGAGHLELQEWRGLKPRDVMPIPTFNGRAIPLREGYVDVRELRLWSDNSRLHLHLGEFRRLHHREPTDEELLRLLQGTLRLPQQGLKKDEFELIPLAASIAAKGVQVPPIIDWWGVPRDGNRRIAASMYVLASSQFGQEEKERARMVRVWQAPDGTTDDQWADIVVSLNFEDDHKLAWPEYVKARQVADEYESLRERELAIPTPARDRDLRHLVARKFAIKLQEVSRYVRMVQWAEQFQAYLVDDRGEPEGSVQYRTDALFQYFYELDAGKGPEKFALRMQADDTLRAMVFDMMFDGKFRNYAEVRDLRKVIASPVALRYLEEAHAERSIPKAKDLVDLAVLEARRSDIALRRLNLRQWSEGAIKQLTEASPGAWHELDTPLLRELRRCLYGTLAAVQAELGERGIAYQDEAPE
jgi:hypothetical protein